MVLNIEITMKEIMKCHHCEKEIERKHKVQKYCCVCSGIMNRLLGKKRRDEKRDRNGF